MMARPRKGFCVAAPGQLAQVRTPAELIRTVGPDLVLELGPGLTALDPVVELAYLVAILAGDPSGGGRVAGAQAWEEPGLATYRVDAAALLTLQGADGDPEMEWDDVLALWKTADGSASVGCDDEELLTMIDRLRLLAGQTTAESSIYCWSFDAAVPSPTAD